MDGIWLDLHELGCFLQLAQQGNVGRAADVLGLETAMLVESVRQLEDDVEVDLVRWDQVPVVLTAAGEQLLRLVDLGIQDLRRLQDIEHVKDFYRAMPAPAQEYFPPVAWRDPRQLIAAQNVRPGPLQLLSTSAATVAVINSAVLGMGIALLSGRVLPIALCAVVGAAAGLVAVTAALGYQWRTNVRAFTL